MIPRVVVLCEGMIRRDGKIVLEAHSSSTLVDCGDRRIVVDTSTPTYRCKVIEGLQREGVAPGSVSMVVTTHAHHDHEGNNDLFSRARVVVFAGEGRMGEETVLAEGVRLVRTPGHTPESASVFVEAEKKYAIVGDAIPTEDNYLKWVPPRANYDAGKALESMRRIVDFADVIVPGHGPAFEVKKIS